RSDMTHRSTRLRGDQERIAITVGTNALELEDMAGGLAFFPQSLLAAAEEHDASARERFPQRVLIHIAEHQHRAGAGVLDDRRQQASAFAKVERVDIGSFHDTAAKPPSVATVVSLRAGLSATHGLTSIPAARNSRFKSGIAIAPV